MAQGFEHFVMTYFSVRHATARRWAAFPTPWLEARLALFEAFCLPSVAAQRASDFRWLVFCDVSTELACLTQLRRQAELCPQLEVILTDDRCDPVAVVNGMVAEATSVVLTTHLDSDDGLHVNALNRAQQHVDGFVASQHVRWLHNAPRGIRYDAGARIAYRSQLANSPFHTLFERRRRGGSVLTAMSGNHSRLHQEYATHQDYALTGWLQVIHGGNLANRITGFDTETTAVDLEESFGVVPPGRRSFYAEIPPLAG